MIVIIFNVIITITMILRFLAINITKRVITSGKYEEANSFSRMLLKRTGYIYLYNISIFIVLYVFCNITTFFDGIISVFVLIILLIHFLLIFIDFLWDYSSLKKSHKEKEVITIEKLLENYLNI